jgi:tetraacyldisaccharide 4'-kinase
MNTPAFWQSRNLVSTALLPMAALYELGSTLRARFSPMPAELSVPVICVGNVTAGGAGKTPVAIAIGERLKAKNIDAYFLSRGYGGAHKSPLLVNPKIHAAHEVGDEPLLLAQNLPTVVAKNRLLGAKFAIERGARAIIMDDGFQNPLFTKALSLLVIDGVYGFGNGRLLPAGPLRESPQAGFARADAIVLIGPKTMQVASSLPVLSAVIAPKESAKLLAGKKVLAFCGLAYPQKFFATLKDLNANIVEAVVFADHYPYTEHDIRNLGAKAKRAQAILVTTAKDAMRLRAEWRSRVTVVDISLIFEQPETLDSLLDTALKKQTW